jgi:hypothetical protein
LLNDLAFKTSNLDDKGAWLGLIKQRRFIRTPTIEIERQTFQNNLFRLHFNIKLMKDKGYRAQLKRINDVQYSYNYSYNYSYKMAFYNHLTFNVHIICNNSLHNICGIIH